MTTTATDLVSAMLPEWGKPGFFRGIPADDYYSLDAASYSRLSTIGKKSPLHLQYEIEHGREPTESMKLGRDAHAAMFEPERFAGEFLVSETCSATYTSGDKKGQRCRNQGTGMVEGAWVCGQHGGNDGVVGKEVVGHDAYKKICGMQQSVRSHEIAAGLVRSQGWTEASMLWEDANQGILCKSRADRVVRVENLKFPGKRPWSGLGIVDLKTTDNAGPDGFRDFIRTSLRMFYHVQAAMYWCGVMNTCQHILKSMKLDGQKAAPCRFFYIAVETEPPHAVCVYEVRPSLLQHGWNVFQRLLGVYAECKRTGVWPGYGAGLIPMEKPDWVPDEEVES